MNGWGDDRTGTNEWINKSLHRQIDELRRERHNEWTNEWMKGWSNERIDEWPNDRIRMNVWMNEPNIERTDDRMNKRTNERTNERWSRGRLTTNSDNGQLRSLLYRSFLFLPALHCIVIWSHTLFDLFDSSTKSTHKSNRPDCFRRCQCNIPLFGHGQPNPRYELD